MQYPMSKAAAAVPATTKRISNPRVEPGQSWQLQLGPHWQSTQVHLLPAEHLPAFFCVQQVFPGQSEQLFIHNDTE